MTIIANNDVPSSFTPIELHEVGAIAENGSNNDGAGKGDSGGPLVVKDNSGQDVLIGVNSRSQPIGSNTQYRPSVFVRVSSIIDWILEKTVAVLGSTNMCGSANSETFIVENLPFGSTVTWEKNCNHILLNGTTANTVTDNSITVSRNPNNPAGGAYLCNLKATVEIPGVPLSDLAPPIPRLFEIERSITVGTVPNTANISSSRNNGNIFHGDNCVTEDFVYYHGTPIKAGNSYGITDVGWASSGLSLVSMSIHNDPFLGIYGTITKISAPSFFGSAEFQVKLKNHCGWSLPKTITYYEGLPCPGGGIDPPCFTCWQVDIYPNPVDDVLSIVFKHLPIQENQKQRSIATAYSVKLYDVFGTILRQTEFTHTNKTNINFELNQLNSRTEPVNFNVSNLKEGTYYLHIEGNGEIEKKQIVVRRK